MLWHIQSTGQNIYLLDIYEEKGLGGDPPLAPFNTTVAFLTVCENLHNYGYGPAAAAIAKHSAHNHQYLT